MSARRLISGPRRRRTSASARWASARAQARQGKGKAGGGGLGVLVGRCGLGVWGEKVAAVWAQEKVVVGIVRDGVEDGGLGGL